MASCLPSGEFSGMKMNQKRDTKRAEEVEILRLFKERYGRIDWHVRGSKMMKQTGKGLLSNLSNQKNNSFLKEN